jgi:hypothetical protein
VPFAANCWVWPAIRDNDPVTAMDFNEGATITVAVPETPENVAVIVLVPALTPVTIPPAAMVATDVLDEDHATYAVKF